MIKLKAVYGFKVPVKYRSTDLSLNRAYVSHSRGGYTSVGICQAIRDILKDHRDSITTGKIWTYDGV